MLEKPLMQAKNIDQLLKKVGDSNRYQIIILFIFLIQWMTSVILLFGPSFFLDEPQFVCPGNTICEDEEEGCLNGGILYQPQKITMTTEFELYCDRSFFRTWASSLTFIGSIFGNFLMSFLAERYGRRPIMIICWGTVVFGIIGMTCSVNVYMLLVFQFFAGLGIIPSNSLNLVILGEQYGNKYRQKATTIILMSWSLFEIWLTFCVYFTDSWRTVYIYFLSIPCALTGIANFYLSESPKYCLTRKQDQLLDTLNSIANKNKKQELVQDEVDEVIKSSPQLQSVKEYNFIDLFRINQLRNVTIACCLCMFISQLAYYATQFSLNDIGSNTYINAICVAVGELCAYFLSNQIIILLKRKKFTIIFMLASNFLCLLSFAFTSEDLKIFQTINSALIRVFNCLTFAIQHVYVQELFPTPVRSIGVGIQMGIGLIGSALAPFALKLFKHLKISQMGGVGLIFIPFNFGNLLFKETKDLKLQDTLDDQDEIADDYIRKKSIISFDLYEHNQLDKNKQKNSFKNQENNKQVP